MPHTCSHTSLLPWYCYKCVHSRSNKARDICHILPLPPPPFPCDLPLSFSSPPLSSSTPPSLLPLPFLLYPSLSPPLPSPPLPLPLSFPSPSSSIPPSLLPSPLLLYPSLSPPLPSPPLPLPLSSSTPPPSPPLPLPLSFPSPSSSGEEDVPTHQDYMTQQGHIMPILSDDDSNDESLLATMARV